MLLRFGFAGGVGNGVDDLKSGTRNAVRGTRKSIGHEPFGVDKLFSSFSSVQQKSPLSPFLMRENHRYAIKIICF